MKALLAGLLAAAWVLAAFWLGGFDFASRGYVAVQAFILASFAGFSAWGFMAAIGRGCK